VRKVALLAALAAGLVAGAGVPARAQRQVFVVDPASSQVNFSLETNTHRVNGTFHVQTGTVDFDRSGQTISGSIVVAAGSGSSGEPRRDEKMKSEVLDVGHYAEISFRPERVLGVIGPSGDSVIQVSGVFMLHGTPHELTAPIALHISDGSFSAKTNFAIPYVKWGLKDPSVFILRVAKEVEVDLVLAGTVEK
jgi:polyisoprenoid-binding protein YceI